MSRHSKGGRAENVEGENAMIDLPYTLMIEATQDPGFFGFYSNDLEGFSGVGHSVEDCLYKARIGMSEHIELLKEKNLPIPPRARHPRIIIENESALKATA